MKKKLKYGLLLLLLVVTTGCTTYLKSSDGKAVVNPTTGQSLAENILCRPTDAETIKLYEDNGYDLTKLPYCVCKSDKVIEKVKVEKEETKEEVKETKNKKDSKEEAVVEEQEVEYQEVEVDCEEFKVTSGSYEGLWTSIFVKPLAYIILKLGYVFKSWGLTKAYLGLSLIIIGLLTIEKLSFNII